MNGDASTNCTRCRRVALLLRWLIAAICNINIKIHANAFVAAVLSNVPKIVVGQLTGVQDFGSFESNFSRDLQTDPVPVRSLSSGPDRESSHH